MAEVQDRAPAVLVRVRHDDPRLVRRGRAHHLLLLELPVRPPGEEARLHDLGHPLPPLGLGQRREELRVDHDRLREMERARQVLADRQVDPGLAADRRVHLADERRRHRDPRDAAQVGGRDEASEVGGRPAAEGDERPRLGRSPARPRAARRPRAASPSRPTGPDAARRRVPGSWSASTRSSATSAVGRPSTSQSRSARRPGSAATWRHSSSASSAFSRDAVAGLQIDVCALLVERPERRLVLRERTLATAHPRPGQVDADLDPDGERPPRRAARASPGS